MQTLHLEFRDGEKAVTRETKIVKAVIAGWTGRDAGAVEKHIAELEALGVKRPETTPIFYRVAASRLTTAPAIEVLGTESSGEAEFVLLQAEGRLWVGAGSDHTDRKVEAYNVSVSKQVCDKPVTTVFWAYENFAGHWDDLVLRSYVHENGVKRLYQEGKVSAMLRPDDLIARHGGLDDGTMMFCGTLPVIGAFATNAERFDFALEDSTAGRAISGSYSIVTLANMG